MDPEALDKLVSHVQFVVKDGRGVASEVTTDGHAYTIYTYDQEGARHASGDPSVHRDEAVLASRNLRVPLVTIDHDLVSRIREIRSQLSGLTQERAPQTSISPSGA